jgi:hypothetical protein
MTGPQPLPKRVVHRARSNALSINFQSLLVSLITSISCLSFLPRLPVPYILNSIFFNGVFQKAVPTQDVTNTVTLSSFYFM